MRRWKLRKEGGLQEEGSEGAGSGIGDGIALVGAAAGIGERSGGLAEVVPGGNPGWNRKRGPHFMFGSGARKVNPPETPLVSGSYDDRKPLKAPK